MEMSNNMFNELINKLEVVTGTDLETVGVDASYKMYSLSMTDEDSKLTIEDFGYSVNNKWTSLIPTKEQLYILKLKINNIITSIEESIKYDSIKCDYDVREEQGVFGYGY